MKLTEDDIYRSSTQFANWSFTPAKLAEQRLQTNVQASERVKAAFARQRAHRAQNLTVTTNDAATPSASESEIASQDGRNTPVRVDQEVNCLTVAEEKRLVDTFCERGMELGHFLKFPIEVTATGVQFLRRFYLFNSPMTYEPQIISRSVMYLASKAENAFDNVDQYASKLPKTTAESVLAPEYLIVQGLRFNFEVRHPFRGLKGGHLELIDMARGHSAPLPNTNRTPTELQNEMLVLPRKPDGPATANMSVQDLEKRITDAYGFASHILKNAALVTDTYFLYTPSHIWLSAHLLADEPLTLFYLSTKTSPTHPLYSKLLSTLRSCASLLSSHRSWDPSLPAAEKAALDKKDKDEVGVLMKKLRQCRDPDKLDLVKLNQAQKRDAMEADDELEEREAKRRKVGKEDTDEFWGPALQKKENGAKAQ